MSAGQDDAYANQIGELADAFAARFGRRPTLLAHAGGRVNLIGEHTDYHEGFVLPAAIDLRTFALAAPRDDGSMPTWSIWSDAAASGHLCRIGTLQLPAGAIDWRTYVTGPLWALHRSGYRLPGADVLVAGSVPLGGGLSSSASLQVALVGLGAALCGEPLPALEAARIAHEAEHEYCRVPCGVMDQLATACGADGCALLIDCRSLAITEVTLPASLALVVADSGVEHAVADDGYARRQLECAEGLAALARAGLTLRAARDLTLEMLEAERRRLSAVAFRRLRHVVSENRRVLDAHRALQRGDFTTLGALLCRSHESLARDYEVSCAELDALVEAALGVPGVHGARLTGAGFGGNTVNLVDAAGAETIAGAISEGFASKIGRRAATRVVRPAAGLTLRRPDPNTERDG